MEKTEITSKLDQLNPVMFRYKSDPSDSDLRYGLIAEEVDVVFPEMVYKTTDQETDDITVHGVRYDQFIPTLIAAFQASQIRLAEQDSTIENLTARMTLLESQFAIGPN
jgi:hypothetical protein